MDWLKDLGMKVNESTGVTPPQLHSTCMAKPLAQIKQ